MIRTGSSGSKRRQTALHHVLIGSALAGISSLCLFNDQARALTTPCGFGGDTQAPACQIGYPYDSSAASDKQITILQGPTAGQGTIEFNWIPIIPEPGYANDLWEVDVDFQRPLQDPASGFLNYMIEITPPNNANYRFNKVRLKADILSGSPVVSKSIYSDDAFTNKIFEIIGGNGFVSLPQGYTKLYVRDSYALQGQSDVLDNFQNLYTQTPVPGPLPLFGAGAAMAFSRRLRRRTRSPHLPR